MSLLSRSTGGRRFARTAAVTAGTLLVWLVVSAIPAVAVSTCDTVATGGAAQFSGSLQLAVNIGADDKVVLFNNAGQYQIAVNGGAFANCGATAGASTGANVGWINVVGSDAGAETYTVFNPPTIPNVNLDVQSVDLKNGNDTLVLEYGALASPATVDPDPGTAADVTVGTSAGGKQVADTNFNGTADLRIDNAETITLNGDNTGNDELDAGNLGGLVAITTIDTPVGTGITGDDIPAAANPATSNLNLNGLGGDDNLVSGDGSDNFQGGPGADSVDYGAASGPVVIDLTAATGTGMGSDTLADVQNAFGSEFADTITGNSLNNVLRGLNPALNTGALDDDDDDVIDGLAGADTMSGEDGNDTILQGTAADGADTINGGSNTADGDTVDYSGRTNALYVAPGAGAVSGEGGCPLGTGCEDDNVGTDLENFTLGSGADEFVGSGNAEFVTPGAGDDDVDGNGGADTLDLSDAAGDVTVDLPGGTATGNGSDTFEDIEGVATGDGNDTVIWDGETPAALVEFNGGAGTDTVDASSATVAVNINLTAINPDDDVENLTGGSGSDTLVGNVRNNVLIGNDGDDEIDAGNGNDSVEGGQGNDLLSDGGGADVLVYRNAPSGVTVDTANGFASGGDGEDSIFGLFETVLGSDFDDDITGGQSSVDAPNTLKGFGGNDVITGTNSTDTIRGGAGNDELRGGSGDDLVAGSGGNDILFGSAGDDRLKGGGGNDNGIGGRGFDICKGTEKERSCEG